MRGNHHDAWVNGADDPLSGMVALLEEARAVGELTKTGWRRRRTIVYCAWDGEEPGLLGSTEWAETHAEELRRKAAVYVNSDSNGRGFLYAGGSHTLEKFVNEVARDVTDPQKKITVQGRARARRLRDAPLLPRHDRLAGRQVPALALRALLRIAPRLQAQGRGLARRASGLRLRARGARGLARASACGLRARDASG
mgnify:CR=1 FL=1